jgi:hypothetical protein
LVFDIQANCAGYSLERLASPASESPHRIAAALDIDGRPWVL